MHNLLFISFLNVLVSCTTPTPVATTPTSTTNSAAMTSATASNSIFDIPLKTIDGRDITLKAFKGKKLLIVNVASKCGYTKQYADLEKLHKMHGDKVVVLGFPANDFGGQEPGANEDIAEFCQKNFGVTFPLFEKASVIGNEQQPLYKWLTSKEANGTNSEAPAWNFSKYLISEDGKIMKFYPSKVSPLSEELLRDINS